MYLCFLFQVPRSVKMGSVFTSFLCFLTGLRRTICLHVKYDSLPFWCLRISSGLCLCAQMGVGAGRDAALIGWNIFSGNEQTWARLQRHCSECCSEHEGKKEMWSVWEIEREEDGQSGRGGEGAHTHQKTDPEAGSVCVRVCEWEDCACVTARRTERSRRWRRRSGNERQLRGWQQRRRREEDRASPEDKERKERTERRRGKEAMREAQVLHRLSHLWKGGSRKRVMEKKMQDGDDQSQVVLKRLEDWTRGVTERRGEEEEKRGADVNESSLMYPPYILLRLTSPPCCWCS